VSSRSGGQSRRKGHRHRADGRRGELCGIAGNRRRERDLSDFRQFRNRLRVFDGDRLPADCTGNRGRDLHDRKRRKNHRRAFSGSSGRRPAAQCQIEARAATAPSKSVERRHVDACRAEKNTIRIAAPIAKTATTATPITRESNPTTVTSLVRFRDDCGSRRPSVARKRDVVPAGAAVRSGSLTCRVTAFSTTARRSVMRTRRGLSRGIFVSEYRCLSTSDLTRAPRV
jgi:hypothetical protein